MVIPSKSSIITLVYKSMKLNFISYTKHLTAGTNDINSTRGIQSMEIDDRKTNRSIDINR